MTNGSVKTSRAVSNEMPWSRRFLSAFPGSHVNLVFVCHYCMHNVVLCQHTPCSHIDSTGTIEGALHLKPEHLAVFDCSFRPQNGLRATAGATIEKVVYRPVRRKLPDERRSITHKFSIGGHEGYITVGMYDDGAPGEIFITVAKEGSTISGLMDAFATAVSFNLQYGVPIKFLVDKFAHVRFEPSGWTGNQQIPYAKSIMDYIFR
jgi:hypothetical protein